MPVSTPSSPSELSESGFRRDPDVQLMLRVKTGDQEAFNQLVSNYQDRLIGILCHLVGDQEAAEDLAQEVFLRIFRAREGYEPTARFSTWLFRIANNLASNSRRNKGRRKEVNFKGATESAAVSVRPEEKIVADKSALMPVRQLDKQELQKHVQTAMEALSERQRMAVLLHKFEDMSYADIAESMDLTVQAVKSLLSRARENLREQLEKYVQLK